MPARGRGKAWLRHINACTRKVRYDTSAQAQAIARGLRRQGDRVNAYVCAACKGWHVGHPSPGRRADGV